jgi:hypothetical protein
VQECSKLDIGKILHSNVACVDIAWSDQFKK